MAMPTFHPPRPNETSPWEMNPRPGDSGDSNASQALSQALGKGLQQAPEKAFLGLR